MAKQESTQQLVNQLEDAVKTSQELLKQYNTLSKLISQTATDLKEGFGAIDKNTTKGLAEFNKLLKQTNKILSEEEKTNQEIAKTERELIKNQQELSKLRQQQIREEQANLRLQKQVNAEEEKRQKEAEKEAKRLKDENDAYKVKSKRLNQLRNEYKTLAAAQGKSTKATKKLLKEIQDLDKELKDIDASVGQFQRSVGNYPKVINKSLASIKGFTAALISLGGAAFSAKSALSSTEEGSEDLREATAKAEGATKAVMGTVGTFANETLDLVGKLWENAKDVDGFSKAIDNLANGYDKTIESGKNLEQNIKDQSNAYAEAERQQIALEKKSNLYRTTVAQLTAEYEKQVEIAGRDTLGMESINEATEKAQQISIQISKIRQKEIQAEIDILKIKRDASQEGANNLALNTAISEKEAELTEEKGRQVAENIALEELQQKNKRDIFEKDLDYAIDAFDTQKTINERLLAEEGKTLDSRRQLLDETIVLADSAYEDQTKLTNDYLAEQGEQVIDFNELLKETDQKRVVEMVKASTTDEIVLQRVLDIWRERKIVVQDLAEEEKTYWETYIENVNLQQETEAKRQRNAGTLDKYERKIKEDRIKAIKLEQDAYEKYSNAWLELESERLDLSYDLMKENLEKKKELIEAGIGVIEKAFDKSNEKRRNNIEKQLSESQKRAEEISKAAEMGNEAAKESLAAEERKQAELEKKKEQQRKKEQRQDMLIAGLNLLAENADQPNALGKSISDVTAMIGIISSLPTYLKGTEDTGNGGSLDNNGGFLSVLHPNERVMTKEQNKALGGLTNDEVAELGKLHNMGAFEYSPVIVENNKKLESKVAEMTEAVKTLHERIPIQRVDYDAKSKEHIHTIESNNKTEKLRTKAKNVWR